MMRIIDWEITIALTWQYTVEIRKIMAWRPVFAIARPQLIFMPIEPQFYGRIRCARLCSSPVALLPY